MLSVLRFSWVESHFEDVVVVVFLGDGGTGVGVGATTAVATETVHVSAKFSSVSSISLSRSSSSPVISWKNQVSSTIVPVISRTVHVVSKDLLFKEKLVPMVVLENDLRSYNNAFAAVGLIKR